MKTIKKLKEEKNNIEGKYELLKNLTQTNEVIHKRRILTREIIEINIKIQILLEVLVMMSNMQFIGAGEIGKQLRSNITGEPIHQGYVSGN